MSILDGNLISSLSDGRSDPGVCAIRSGRARLLASLKEANICTESRHCWILDFFFFNPGSAPLSYCRLKLESYLFFSSGNMFAVTLMLRNQIKIAPSLKM